MYLVSLLYSCQPFPFVRLKGFFCKGCTNILLQIFFPSGKQNTDLKSKVVL